MVTADDVVIAYSNSGETGEVLNILPSLKRIGAKLIAVVGKKNSTLAKNADAVLDAGVEKKQTAWGSLRRARRRPLWLWGMRSPSL